MAANPLESSIPPTAAWWFWWCRLALNLLNDIFSIRICPPDLGDNMLSQKLLVRVGIDMFAGEHWPSGA
jgi:hypothetical protein